MAARSGYAPNTVAAVAALLDDRATAEGRSAHGAEPVDLELIGEGNGPWRIRKGGFEFVADEPAQRGGSDAGPNPLAYFLGGAASCFLSHLMLSSIQAGVVHDAVAMSARGYFDRRLSGGSFTRLVYSLQLEGPASTDAVTSVVREAEKACYAHNTLVRAGIELTIDVVLAGETVLRLVADASHLPGDVPRASTSNP